LLDHSQIFKKSGKIKNNSHNGKKFSYPKASGITSTCKGQQNFPGGKMRRMINVNSFTNKAVFHKNISGMIQQQFHGNIDNQPKRNTREIFNFV
jgi:hypothetical protein